MNKYISGQIGVEQLLAFAFGLIFVVVLLVFAVAIPNPTEFTQFVFRVVLSLAAAGVGAILPGLLHVTLPGVRAGGAIALFAIVYFLNPPGLIKETVEERTRRGLTDAYQMINRGNIDLALDYLEKSKNLNPEPVEIPFCWAS